MCYTPFHIDVATPRYVNGKFTQTIPVDCGKCPQCKIKRLRQWVFRLKAEEKNSTSAHFITLTYDNETIPLCKGNYMTLLKRDVQLFLKRLRKRESKLTDKSIKYYLVGEYGGITQRPHYHAIIFNVVDKENIVKTWQNGSVHFGDVTGASIAYCLKYMDKPAQIPMHKNDHRLKEFSLKSTNIGKCYLTPQVIKYHRKNLDRPYLVQDGYKIPMPKYYKQLIFDHNEQEVVNEILNAHFTEVAEKAEERNKKNNKPYLYYEEQEKKLSFKSFNKNLNKRNRL